MARAYRPHHDPATASVRLVEMDVGHSGRLIVVWSTDLVLDCCKFPLAHRRRVVYGTPLARRHPHDESRPRHPPARRRDLGPADGVRDVCRRDAWARGRESGARLGHRCPRGEARALGNWRHRGSTRGRPPGRPFRHAVRPEREGDAQLEEAMVCIEAPPERERPSARGRGRRMECTRLIRHAITRDISEHRAPAPLHEGRADLPSTDRNRRDPGTKGWRVAWTTPPRREPRRVIRASHTHPAASPRDCVDRPAPARSGIEGGDGGRSATASCVPHLSGVPVGTVPTFDVRSSGA